MKISTQEMSIYNSLPVTLSIILTDPFRLHSSMRVQSERNAQVSENLKTFFLQPTKVPRDCSVQKRLKKCDCFFQKCETKNVQLTFFFSFSSLQVEMHSRITRRSSGLFRHTLLSQDTWQGGGLVASVGSDAAWSG